MHRRAERALLLAILGVGGGWAARPVLRTARWLLQGAWDFSRLPATPPTPQLTAPRHIAHAGGALGAMHYTNALEALERNYARGVGWFEADFLPD